jgi:hypothetical protein
MIRLMARMSPLRDEMRKAPGYLALAALPLLSTTDVEADLRQSLASDPYAPDLLNGLIWVELQAGENASAAVDMAKLQRVEPGFVPTYLQQR